MDTKDIYLYILNYYVRYLFVPTVRDLSKHFSCSTSTIHVRLKDLEENGDIIRKKDGSSYRLAEEIMIDLIMKQKKCVECGQCNGGQCVMYEDE